MKIGIIGGGVVGQATARVWLEHCEEVRICDISPERRTHGCILDVVHCDIVFICLPENRLDEIFHHPLLVQKQELCANYVLKSTVAIGTTRRLAKQYALPNLVHSPEFLTARCAMTDAQCPSRNIVGVPGYSISIHDSGFGLRNQCGDLLGDLYKKRFPGTAFHYMSSDESEAVKLFTNGFFATKVSYFNEVRALADKLELDWQTILGGMLSDGRIAHSHTQVPGPDGKRGFGGACLQKDLQMLLECLEDNQITADGVVVGAGNTNQWARKLGESNDHELGGSHC